MGEKIMITQAQAELVEKVKTQMKGVRYKDLIKALEHGYEIKPEYKPGDWVLWGHQSDKKILEIKEFTLSGAIFTDSQGDEYSARYIQRHVTIEEVKAEQERRKWAEIEPGDVLIHKVTGQFGVFVELAGIYVEVKTGKAVNKWAGTNCELYAKKVKADV